HPDYESAFKSSLMILRQAAEGDGAKRMYHRGPAATDRIFVTDAAIMLEAVAQFGSVEDSMNGVKAIWDLQDDTGLITAGGGKSSLKETGAALYLLGRHCDLAQNWDLFNQLWPDAVKAVM